MSTASTISNKHNTSRKKKRVGRGNASGKGTYSARGMKGQRARSGGKGGGKLRGLKQAILKVPKLRGFKSIHAKNQTVTLNTLERAFNDGQVITPYLLETRNLIKTTNVGVKIVATGAISKKFTIQGCLASKTAVAAIEKAGGSISF